MFKLVRDNTPGIIKEEGKICNYAKVMNDELFHEMLRQKLADEANEFLQKNDLDSLVDIYTVITTLAEEYNQSLEDAYEQKKALKGTFKERYIAFFPDSIEGDKNDK